MQQVTEQVVQIELENLRPDVENRKIGGYDDKKLEQLAESIRAVGVQQPAVVRLLPEPIAGQKVLYEIVAGARRWRASKLAGLETMPCVVRDLDDVTVLKIRTIENLQREDVHPLDEAHGFAQLLDRGVYDHDHLAKELGKSLSYVYQRLKLLDLIAPAREMLVKGKLSAGHAILIARLQPDQQKEVVGSYLFKRGEAGPSVRELDEFIRESVLMDLAKTAFPKDDAALVPGAGACAECQKRTGFHADLFADVCKKDFCMDRSCFRAKMDALVARRQAEIAGEAHLLVREGYGTAEKDVPKGALDHWQWHECKKSEEGAVRCLVVDGVGRGRLTWGREDKGYKHEKTPQEKANEQKKKRELELKRLARRRVWDEMCGKLQKDLSNSKHELPLELLRVVAAHAWDRLWDNHKVLLAKTEGWEQPKKKEGYYGNGRDEQGKKFLENLDRQGLILFLVKIALIHSLDVQPQYGPQFAEKTLHAAANILGLDPKAIEAKVRKEAVEPKAKAKGKPKPKAR